MIDVYDLEGLLELANDYVDDGLHFLTEPVSYGELKLLTERLISAEKDAARYRWLMENCGKILEPARNRTHLYLPNYCPLSMDYVDVSKHIDEAMQCSK